MRKDLISWKAYMGERKVPRLMTLAEILKKQVNKEAEMTAKPEPVWKPMKIELPAVNLCPHDTGVWNFAKSLLP